MRKIALIALAIWAGGCGRGDRGAPGAAAAPTNGGPDPIVVRIPRDGGVVRAYRYPALDSVLWRSSQPSPATERVLAFDAENGVLAYLDREGRAGWLDLRLGTVRPASRERMSALASVDGWSIFGVSASNALRRMSPSDEWSMGTRHRVRRLFPLPDGTLLVLADGGSSPRSVLLRVRPPDEAVSDSLELERPDRGVATSVGDRVYFGSARSLVGVRPLDFSHTDHLKASDDILAIAPTPSGDRIFVADKGSERLDIVDRYSGSFAGSVKLPGLVTDLRMDPMGRYVLARPVRGDSAWVVAIANQQFVGSVSGAWREDLPAVTVDGLIAMLAGADVVFTNAATRQVVRRVAGGAADLWFFTLWNGFRPRARELDQPVSFALGDSSEMRRGVDTTSAASGAGTVDTIAAALLPPPAAAAPPTPAVQDAWTVSFAMVLADNRAREIAATIVVDGQHPRVVPRQTAGTTVYRVIFGPFATKAEAERMGRSSNHNYWVFEGVP